MFPGMCAPDPWERHMSIKRRNDYLEQIGQGSRHNAKNRIIPHVGSAYLHTPRLYTVHTCVHKQGQTVMQPHNYADMQHFPELQTCQLL